MDNISKTISKIICEYWVTEEDDQGYGFKILQIEKITTGEINLKFA